MAIRRLWTAEFLDAVNPRTLSVGFQKAPPGWSGRWNKVQTDFDIWYVSAGHGEVMIDGRWHAFHAGELITLKPGCVWQGERTDTLDPYHVYYAHVLPFGDGHPALTAALAARWPLRLSLLNRPDIARIFESYYEAFIGAHGAEALAVRGFALQLLSVIFAEIRRPSITIPPRSYARLLLAKKFIERHYQRPLRLAEIAANADLSQSHLCALFKKHLGFPPVEFLIRIRIREAKILLGRGCPVKEVAAAVGCHSQHYFSRLFSRRAGEPPSRFAVRFGRRLR